MAGGGGGRISDWMTDLRKQNFLFCESMYGERGGWEPGGQMIFYCPSVKSAQPTKYRTSSSRDHILSRKTR